MLQTVITRKNLLAISLSVFYAVVLAFTGMCLDDASTAISRKNPIAMFGKGIGFKSIEAGATGFIALLLIAFYVVVLTATVAYERRYAIVNNMKPASAKMLAVYFGTAIVCFALSLGLGLLIQKPGMENITNVLTYIGQSLALGTLLFVGLLLVIGAVLMFIVNFINIDKPFKFFDKSKQPVFNDDDLELNADVRASFDVDEPASMPGFGQASPVQGGAPAAVSGSGDGAAVVRNVEALDDREKVFPTLCRIDDEYSGFEAEPVVCDDITLEELCTGFRNYLAKVEHLYYDIDAIRFFVSGFAASHFEILEGLSGTGKSSLPRYFAKYIGANVLFMPVQATWRDKTSVLGFFNEFSKTYNETDFLATLYDASYNTDKIYLFVLDEMNISRVEYYFADFLSVLEFPKDEWKLKLLNIPYGFVPPVNLADGNVFIPQNSYFVGTANKDDSTFTITDKVYDRAITMEFSDKNDPFRVTEEVKTVSLSATGLDRLYRNAMADKNNVMLQADFIKLNKILDYVYDRFGISIGNRIINQIVNIVPVFVAAGGTKEAAIDFMISKKLVSKIEGRFEDYVKDALRGLLDLISKNYGTGVLKLTERCAKNIIRAL